LTIPGWVCKRVSLRRSFVGFAIFSMKRLSATLSLLVIGAAGGVAQEASLSPSATPASLSASAEISPTPAAKAASQPATELYSLDYDETKDVFSKPGTTTPFSGPVISHYDGGTVESKGTLLNGRQEGPWVEFYEGGKKSEEGSYHAGVEEGPWKYWFENGQLDSEGAYHTGSPVGPWSKHFESGKMDSEGSYEDGVMNGPWKFYDETTGQVRIITFDHGTQLTH